MSVSAENEKIGNGSVVTGLPRTDVVLKSRSDAAEEPEAEHNTIFDNLVKVEGEVSGLVAYSIYKQNKRAWLNDFIKATGRPPTEAESRSYIIGESTERRLATYRHLAAATLAGQGPETPTSGAIGFRRAANRPASFFIVWAIVLIVAVAVLGYALHAAFSIGK